MNGQIGHFFNAVADQLERRRVSRDLLQLDDRTLADIDLNRGDLESAARGRSRRRS